MDLKNMSADELHKFAKDNGIKLHHAMSNTKKMIAKINEALAGEEKTADKSPTNTDASEISKAPETVASPHPISAMGKTNPEPAEPQQSAKEHEVVSQIEGLNIQAKFENGGFHFRHASGREDSGTLNQPITRIVHCARNVAIG